MEPLKNMISKMVKQDMKQLRIFIMTIS